MEAVISIHRISGRGLWWVSPSAGFEGYMNGAWWEVTITVRRSNMFLTRFHGPEGENEGDEQAWVPIDNLRLRARRCDDWDCGILRRGVDVSVYSRHPEAKLIQPNTTKAPKVRDMHRNGCRYSNFAMSISLAIYPAYLIFTCPALCHLAHCFPYPSWPSGYGFDSQGQYFS